MRALARIGFILVGLHVALSSLAALGQSFRAASITDSPIDPAFFLASIAFSLLLGIVPGVLLILWSHQLSGRVVPQGEPAPSAKTPDILTALTALLGAYFLIRGTAEVVAGMMIAGVFLGSGFDALLAEYSRSLLAALMRAVAGLFLFLYPGRMVALITNRVGSGLTSGGRAA